ncbi:MAG: PIN domain-containing protein [Phycisphaerales bacterium JB039]
MKQRIYLDTSVLSALGDTRAPDRQVLTREFFDRIDEFEVATSELTRTEIENTRDDARRAELLGLLSAFTLLPVMSEAEQLSQEYLAAGVFTLSTAEDGLHVAIAVLSRQDVLVSWNFKHLVNQRRRAAVQAINARLGLPPIAILPPPEL